ncbi:hypothetical protein J4231_00490 [Candidatus Woesearchaeota archaeon]|nr:hypothetical protein [Candidatus Woesearchaeota archaeon]
MESLDIKCGYCMFGTDDKTVGIVIETHAHRKYKGELIYHAKCSVGKEDCNNVRAYGTLLAINRLYSESGAASLAHACVMTGVHGSRALADQKDI